MRFRFGRLANGVAVALLVFGTIISTAGPVPPALAGSIGNAAGFEDDDGDLKVDSTFDWNGFSATTWSGSPPYQTSSLTASGWAFTGLTDELKDSDDTGFKGGTKQDDNCAQVVGSSAPNKDDLKRIYVAHKTVSGHIYLELAWIRITQNTTSPSAHVAFEFNQGTSPCGSASDGLVEREPGDLLIVYDFEGGATDIPTITVRRWTNSGACEVGNQTAPCWGTATNLTTAGYAEAKVNTTLPVTDTVAPADDTLGLNEFGEAGIDLTAAGIFNENECTSFGKVSGVSRTSGNSGTAAMEDLVGPGNITITNCGTLVVEKVTVPSPDTTNTSFAFSLNGPNPPNTSLPKSFSLKNGETNSTTVFGGTGYSVAETVPGNWVLTAATCDNGSGSLSGGTISNISVATNGTTTCTFTNTLQLGAIEVTKLSVKGNAPLEGATFAVVGGDVNTTIQTGSDGKACVDGLPFATYLITETVAPTGYNIDNPNGVSVTVNQNATCTSGTPNAPSSAFTDTPLSEIRVQFTSLAGAGVTAASIVCKEGTTTLAAVSENGNADPAFDDTDETFTNLDPGTYTCTIVVDP